MTDVESKDEIYAVFSGFIDSSAVARLFNSLSTAIAKRVPHLHLMLQSSGGNVGDGICIYNFLRHFPIPITLYNCGSCLSIAAIAFLGAEKRETSAYATFMVHRTLVNFQGAAAERLHGVAQSVALDDARTEAILRDRLALSEDQWNQHRMGDLWLSADEAVACGLATGISEFAPPKGAMVFSI